MELAGRVALVTGAASGIGRATAIRLAAEGMRVCAVDLDADGAHGVASDVGGTWIRADVSRVEEIDSAFDHCRREHGAVDLAFLNAGIAIGRADIGALELSEYRRILGANIDGVVFGTRAAIHAMRGRGGGVIVTTASLAGIVPFPPDPVYALTKHAVVGFVRSIASALQREDITVHAICPGVTDTNILSDESKALLRAADFPLMPAEQIAAAVVAAATSPETGHCWVCQPGRPTLVYEFRDVPGPCGAGVEGRVPRIS